VAIWASIFENANEVVLIIYEIDLLKW